jgi:hypothetical protein
MRGDAMTGFYYQSTFFYFLLLKLLQVEARNVQRMRGDVMTDCACRVTFNAAGT